MPVFKYPGIYWKLQLYFFFFFWGKRGNDFSFILIKADSMATGVLYGTIVLADWAKYT